MNWDTWKSFPWTQRAYFSWKESDSIAERIEKGNFPPDLPYVLSQLWETVLLVWVNQQEESPALAGSGMKEGPG